MSLPWQSQADDDGDLILRVKASREIVLRRYCEPELSINETDLRWLVEIGGPQALAALKADREWWRERMSPAFQSEP